VKKQNDCTSKIPQIMFDLVEINRAGNVGKKYYLFSLISPDGRYCGIYT